MSTRSRYGRPVQFRVLGPLEVDAGDGPIPLGGPKQRAVLANLLIRANQVVPADTLIDEVWGEEPPEKARNTLQTYVSNLRRELGDGRLQGRPPGYVLLLDPFELDAARFDSLVRDAKKALSVDPNVAIATLDDALALWRGPALADLADRPSLLAEAARLDELRLEAQEGRVEGLLASGERSRAIGELEGLLAHHELREGLWSLLMLALYREGRQADALNTFQRAREILADELGIDPSPELARLHERILQQDAGLDLKGEPLRGYRLLEKIGDGPDGAVFRAIQPHVERDVATKVFNERIATDPAFVQRFGPAAQSAAALEHPHIVPIYDYWREPGRAYVVSRYLRGGSLQARLDRGDLPAGHRSLRVVEQIASALAFAHQQGIVHGNLRASNVLFDAEQNAYIGDFAVRRAAVTDHAEDLRGLGRLTRALVGDEIPVRLAELCDAVEGGIDNPGALAFGDAARTTLEPGAAGRPRRAEARNPYKGLRAFSEADAGDFFGRGVLVERLMGRLSEPDPGARFLAVVGPSGGGKSSVVRAGLVPAMRRGALQGSTECYVGEMFPGAHPLEELEAALLRVAVRPASRLRDLLETGSRGLLESIDLIIPGTAAVVLVVDQFEEAFTLTTSVSEREAFLENVRVACADPESRLQVIATMRADFYDRPLLYPRFGELLAVRTEAVPPLTPDELEQAIRRPAERVGVRPEPGLVAEMVADVAHQPGALPLLQYALTELFERRDDDVLSLDSYREMGGVAGALSARAERLYQAGDERWRAAVRQVVLRLVTLGEGRQDTRRRVARRELDSLEVDPQVIDDVLEAFGRHRLLTFDREPSTREPTVEIAHESLLTAWARLGAWIDGARDDLRQDQRLARAAAEWRGSDRDPSFLLRGARLDHVEAWASATDLAIGREERGYVKASIDRRDQERTAEAERREHEVQMERRARGRLRALVAVFAMAALVAASLTIIATDQSERAGRAADISQARELAAAAIASIDDDAERAVLLAMEAVNQTRAIDGTVLPEAETALHAAVDASRIVASVPNAGPSVDWSSRGVIATSRAGSGTIDIRDEATGQRLRSLPAHTGDVTGLSFSADGSMLATTGADGWLKIWDPSDGTPISAVQRPWEAGYPSFAADGSLVVATWRDETKHLPLGTVRVVDPTSGTVRRTVTDLLDPERASLSPDGSSVALLSNRTGKRYEGRTIATDLLGDDEVLARFVAEEWDGTASVTWSPDGRYLIGFDGGYIWNAATGRLLSTVPHFDMTDAEWAADAGALATGGSDGTARVWTVTHGVGQELLRLSTPGREVEQLTWSPDGARLATTDSEGSLKIWDIGPSGDAERINLPAPGIGSIAFGPDGRLIVPREDSLWAWDVETGEATPFGPPFREPAEPGGGPRFALSPDGAMGVTAEGMTPVLWNVATGEVEGRIGFRTDLFSWTPDGKYVAAAANGSVGLFDRSGRLARELRDVGFNVVAVEISRDGRMLATTGFTEPDVEANWRVKLWDLERGEIIREIPVYSGRMLFEERGRRIITGDDGGPRPRVWDPETGALVATFPAQPGASVVDMALSPDGSTLALTSDETVRLVDPATGRLRLTLGGEPCEASTQFNVGYAGNLAFSPDGSSLASQCGDTIHVWVLNIDDLLRVAQQNVTRPLTEEECRQYLHLETCPSG